MREIVKMFKVLADETRLRILDLLMEQECCVCEVMQALQISQSKASRGLTALYDIRFLKLRKEGLWSLYSIDREGIPNYQMKIIEAIEETLADNKLTVLDKERLKKAVRGNSRRELALAGGVSFKSTSL